MGKIHTKPLKRLVTEHQEKRKTSSVQATNLEREISALGKFVIIVCVSAGTVGSIWIVLMKIL